MSVSPIPSSIEDLDALKSAKTSFDVLNTRKSSLDVKRGFLFRFKLIDVSLVLPDGPLLSLGSAIIKELQINENEAKRDWNQNYCALIISRLSSLYFLSTQDNCRPLCVGRSPLVLQNVKNFKDLKVMIDTVTKELKHESSVRLNKGRSRGISEQTRGDRIQDTVEFDPSKQEKYPCPDPDCGHFFCMAIESVEEVAFKNKLVDDAYAKKMLEFNNKSDSDKGSKPRSGVHHCQTIACYCYKIHCLLRIDGGHCPICRKLVNTEKTPHVFDVDNRIVCSCDVCACTCQLKFQRNKRHEIAFSNISRNVI